MLLTDDEIDQQAPHVLLRVQGVSKRFGVTQALSDVSVSFVAGEVHALMGENGAGKSTLGKAIAGLHKPDSGQVFVDGQELELGSIHAAFAAGVRIVHQELAQCPNLTVAENLCLHDLPRDKWGLVDRAAMNERAEKLVRRLDPSIDVEAPLGDLAPGRRQICQIAVSLDEGKDGSGGPRIIIFDEPTSSLSLSETERLLEIVQQLAAEGLTIVYVSHRMSEIFACCDRVTVLRDGCYIATSRVADIDEPTLVEQMIGRRLSGPDEDETDAIRAIADDAQHDESSTSGAGKPLLEVREIVSPGLLYGVSFSVAPGEVFGIGGLVGAGRSELMDAIFGLDSQASGQVLIDGESVLMGKPRAMIDAGVGYVPEDRKLQGLFFDLGVDENIVVPFMDRLGQRGLRDMAGERALVADRLARFQVKTATQGSLPGSLSGGNQQKLLIARWMGEGTRVLLLDEPTRGIDVGTKAEVYKLIRAAAAQGDAIVLITSEMTELLALSDRVMVLADGCVAGELAGNEMTQRNVLTLATREQG